MEPKSRENQSFKKRDEDSFQGALYFRNDAVRKLKFEVDERSPFWAIEKGAVLQEARCFNDNQLSARKCQQVPWPPTSFETALNDAGHHKTTLSVQPRRRFHYGIFTFSSFVKFVEARIPQTESTEVFFSVTKLFHTTDGSLRRLLYLIIKEISPSSDEVNIIPHIFSSFLSDSACIGYHSYIFFDERYEQQDRLASIQLYQSTLQYH